MRDLPALWSSAASRGTTAHGFSERNTVMIDDTPLKMREFADNVYIIPEYDEERVALQNEHESGVLRSVLLFLQDVCDHCSKQPIGVDIRESICLLRSKFV
jgi:hypothetical protein